MFGPVHAWQAFALEQYITCCSIWISIGNLVSILCTFSSSWIISLIDLWIYKQVNSKWQWWNLHAGRLTFWHQLIVILRALWTVDIGFSLCRFVRRLVFPWWGCIVPDNWVWALKELGGRGLQCCKTLKWGTATNGLPHMKNKALQYLSECSKESVEVRVIAIQLNFLQDCKEVW